jgi:hypothetical protein
MISIQIPCPECGSELRLRDRSMLGRMGKCPKCGNRFILEEPDEVELELADKPKPAAQPQPRVGAAPKRESERAAPVAPAFLPEAEPAPTLAFAPAAGIDPLQPVKQTRRKRRKKNKVPFILGAFSLVCIVGLVAMFGMSPASSAKPQRKPGKVAQKHDAESAESTDDDNGDPVEQETEVAAGKVKGRPIELFNLPTGSSVVVNLRPAELWSAREGEFIACLGPLGTWLESTLKTVCQEEPKNIEECLLAVIPGIRGTPPDFAAVVHLKNEMKKSDLLERFGGERMDDVPGGVYYVAGDKAYVLRDLKTYAVGPVKSAKEMVEAREYSNPTPAGIDELLPRSDRSKLISMIFVPKDVRLHSEFLAPAIAQPFLQNAIDWISNDDEVESVLWSVELEPKFHSEIVLRNARSTRPPALARAFDKKLQETPHRILDAVEMMNPVQVGRRKIIGRVPAMSKVFALQTRVAVGKRNESFALLTTELPERAGPNLALGTLLAWDESTRTNFNKPKPKGPDKSEGNVPALIADRLKTKIDVDFRRTPLFEAFDYIGAEAKFPVKIDGDALKAAGYTKNMTQTFKLDGASAAAAMEQIIVGNKYDKMCIVVDEKNKEVLVLTLDVAAKKQLTPYQFGN